MGSDDGSFLIVCLILANWGELIRAASIEASRAGGDPPDEPPEPAAGGAWLPGPTPAGMPLIKYSTALSGLWKAATSAFTTWSLVKPIPIRFCTVASYYSPTTRLLYTPEPVVETGPVVGAVVVAAGTVVDGGGLIATGGEVVFGT